MCNFIALVSKCSPELSFFKLVGIVEMSIRIVPCGEITSKLVLSEAIMTSETVKCDKMRILDVYVDKINKF